MAENKRVDKMIWTIALVIGILLIIIHETMNLIEWNKKINAIAQQIGREKRKKPQWKPYSEKEQLEEQDEEDTAFAMPIDILEEEN